MLTKFEVANFKGFPEKLIFNLSEPSNYNFNTECVSGSVVKKALVYGHNGVGKSNLGFAIFDLISHLTDKNSGKEYYSNYLNASSSEKYATFIYEFKFGDVVVKYEYLKESIEKLLYEKIEIDGDLFASLDRREEAKVAIINAEGAETLNRDFGDSLASIVSYIKNNAVLKKNEINDAFSSFVDFVNGMLFFRSLDKNNFIGFDQGSTSIAQDIIEKGLVKEFENFLNKVGIKCVLAQGTEESKNNLYFLFGDKKVNFWDAASQGTKSLSLFYFWLQRMRGEKAVTFLFIDEFDAFYHHELAVEVVELLKQISCQVILTTHNTLLMSNEYLRPDCCFLMNNKKIESLSNLTDKELREAHNIEKMYRAHAFNVEL